MAKMRIHELSKELGKENKDIIDFLNSKGIEVKNHMSSVEDSDVELVKNHFNPKPVAEKTAVKSESKKSENDSAAKSGTTQTAKPDGASAESAPKKKNIIRVVRPQNSQGGMPAGKNRPANNNTNKNAADKKTKYNHQNEEKTFEKPQIRFENSRPARRPEVRTSSESVEDIKSAKERILKAKQQSNVSSSKNSASKETVFPQLNAEKKQHDSIEINNNSKPEIKEEVFKKNNNIVTPGKDRNEKNDFKRDNRSFSKNDSPVKNEERSEGFSDGRSSKHKDFKNNSGINKDFGETRKDGRSQKNSDHRKKNENNSGNESNQKNLKNDNYQKRKGHKDIKNYDAEQDERQASPKRAGAFNKPVKVEKPKKEEESIKLITVPATISIQELADKMKIQPSTIVKKLFMKGTIVTVNQEIEYDTAEEIAMEFDILCEPEKVVDLVEEMLKENEEDEKDLVSRPPVVCVMGHVDHGKTSLLDAIRHTHVIDKEAGGITQHIGAYVVNINGQSITFLDTPGHEAFTAMRMRGASSTDIAILVVAADDGVMPQTIEAINHAKAAGVEIIIAVNKIDKPGANIDRVKQELTEYELIPEDWGGSTVFCPVSAKTGEGIDNLLEMIVLTSEVMELKANPKRTARGLVLEAQLDKGKGPVATVLVQKGTLHVGDPVAAGVAYGKVRAMMDDKGRRLKEAGPSTPVEILGLNDVPGAGDTFIAPETDKEARAFSETYISQNKVHMLSENKSKVKMSLDDLYAQIQEGNLKELDIIVKADVQGSVEAVKQSLEKLSNDEVIVKVIHGGVGAINESDIMLASASNAIIIGFNVRPDAQAKENADHEGVDVRLYRVIYNAIEDIEAAMKGMLEPEFKEQVIGHADIRQTFKASGVGTIAGAYVTDGRFDRSAQVRLVRDGIVVFEGNLASLRRFKDDVKEVKAGYECGFVFENYNDIKEGDQVEAFMMVEVPR